MKWNGLKPGIFIVLSTLLLLWAFIAIALFMDHLTEIERLSTETTLSSIAKSNAEQVRQVFSRYTNTLETTGVGLEGYEELSAPESLAYLSQVEQIDGFPNLSLNYLDGRVITSKGEVLFQRSTTEWADRIRTGHSLILDVSDSLSSNTSQVAILVPLHDQTGTVVAALRCDFTLDSLSNLFDATFSNAGGYYRLIDGNGRHISVSKSPDVLLANQPFLEGLDALNYSDGFSAEEIKTAFFNREEGFTKYSYEGKYRYAYYLPVGINDWMLFMVMPKELMETHTNRHVTNSLVLCAQIAIIFTIFLLMVYYYQKREKTAAILHERYLRVLEEQTGKAIFEWDFSTGLITCLSDFNAIYGRDPFTNRSPEDAISQLVIHEEDHELFRELFSTILEGTPISDARFRILNSDGTFLWSSLSAVVVKDNHNRPFKAIATLENIDSRVRKELDLRSKAEMDGLTGLYNKSTTEYLVKKALERAHPNERLCALMIDVDNFKEVNDTLGHLYGDTVLASLSKHLKQVLSASDIIGRIGGDEFFVFLQNYGSLARLTSKVERIGDRFRNTYEDNGVSVSISASIGVALFPEHGTDFDTIYQHADIALYTAKASGKNTYRIYDGTNSSEYASTRTAIDPAAPLHGLESSHLSKLVNILYHAKDATAAMQSALCLISEPFHFKHSYLFEFDQAEEWVSCTFECRYAKGCKPNSNLQEVPSSKCAFYFQPLHKFDHFILNDRSKIPPCGNLHPTKETQVILLFAIKEQDRLIGFYRFDFCEYPRKFTEMELQTLGTQCHLLSAFLIKQRHLERERTKIPNGSQRSH